jgi:hypothetical protein
LGIAESDKMILREKMQAKFRRRKMWPEMVKLGKSGTVRE